MKNIKLYCLIFLSGSSLFTTAKKNIQLFKKANEYYNDGNFEDAITCYETILKHKPKHKQTLFNKALAHKKIKEYQKARLLLQQALTYDQEYIEAHLHYADLCTQLNRYKEAYNHYEKALTINNTNPEIHYHYAKALNAQKHYKKAISHLEFLLGIEPNHVSALFQLANTYNILHYNDLAVATYKRVLTYRPNNACALYNIAYTLKKIGNIEDALSFYHKAIEQNPNYSEAHFSLGLAYLLMGDFKNGWREYEWRWKRKNHRPKNIFKQPIWNGEPLNGKTIFIYEEQGIGDTFQFIRYAQELKNMGAHIIFACRKALIPLLSLLPYLDQVQALNHQPPNFDCHIPLLSLPYFFKTTLETIPTKIPYLHASNELIKHWNKKIKTNSNVKIGICWQGSTSYRSPFLQAVVAAKSMPLNHFASLGSLENVTLYCLQQVNGMDQLQSCSFPLITFDNTFDKQHGSFMDTAALITCLDLVITIDTSIAHLAAGLGTPVWLLLPTPPDWRWMLDRNDTPWYPNMQLFRQPSPGDWETVMATIYKKLIHYIKDILKNKATYDTE
jgi:tetratricopeptide (TPR) repeat protein